MYCGEANVLSGDGDPVRHQIKLPLSPQTFGREESRHHHSGRIVIVDQVDVAIGHGRKLTSTTLQPEVVGSLVLRVQTAKSDGGPTGFNCCLQI